MMGNSKLSHILIDLGFFSALGTSEHSASRAGLREVYVKRGKPETYDHNNGVMAVYDEEGCPWILSLNNRTVDPTITKIQGHYLPRILSLKRGAYVPHSNDGGHFVREVVANL